MKDWFQGLDAREQKFVMAAAVFVVFAVLYLAIWLPVDKGQKQVNASVEIWQEAVEQIAALKGRVNQGGTPLVSQQNLSQPLVVVVDTTLRSRSLNRYLQRSQPTGQTIRVEFEDVPFDDLVLCSLPVLLT